jgi:hypothetical protein
LRELAGRGGLAGRLSIQDAAGCDSLRLDGRPLSAARASGGMALLAGEHHIICRCGEAGGRSWRRERVSLLPFQDKVLRLCPQPAGEDT